MWHIFRLKEYFDKIKENTNLINSNKDKIARLEGQISILINNEVHEVQKNTSQTPQTQMRKKADKLINKIEIMQKIKDMEQQGIMTTEIYNIIVERENLCKKTCFYKYLRVVREQIKQTPQTN